MHAINEQLIRETAYYIWEQDGCPWGQADRHWHRAQHLLETPAPSKRAPRKAAAPKVAIRKSRTFTTSEPAHMVN